MPAPFALTAVAGFAAFDASLEAISAAANTARDAIDELTQALDRLDDMAKDARGLGLMTEQMRELQLASDFTGLENLVKTFERFEQRLGRAVVEGGRMAETFAQIGLDVERLQSLDPEAAFLEVNAAIQATDDTYQKSFFARELLGARSLRGLNDFAAGLERSERVLARFDLRSNAAGAEELNDKWTEVNVLWDRIGEQVSSDLAPSIASLLESMLKLIELGDDTVGVFDLIGAAALGTAAGIHALTFTIEGLVAATKLAAGLDLTQPTGTALEGLFGTDPSGGRFGDDILNVGAALAGTREGFTAQFQQRGISEQQQVQQDQLEALRGIERNTDPETVGTF